MTRKTQLIVADQVLLVKISTTYWCLADHSKVTAFSSMSSYVLPLKVSGEPAPSVECRSMRRKSSSKAVERAEALDVS
jgi:hypothetical protein